LTFLNEVTCQLFSERYDPLCVDPAVRFFIMGSPRLSVYVGTFGAILAIASFCPAEAATLKLGASNQAWYREDGANSLELLPQLGSINNTFTGRRQFALGPGELTPYYSYHSYFVFDTAAITQPIRAGKVRLFQRQYYSSASQETITLYDVEVSVPDLLSAPKGQAKAMAIFDDLGNGLVYGTQLVSASPTTQETGTFIGQFLDVELTSAAISAINQAVKNSTPFAFGIAVSSLEDSPYVSPPNGQLGGAGFEAIAFSSPNILVTDPDTGQPIPNFPAQLILEPEEPDPPVGVPEPSPLWGTISLLGLGIALRRWWWRP
jgi:hypothetical protein